MLQVLLVCLIALLGPVAADVLEFHNGPRRDGCALASFVLLNFALKSPVPLAFLPATAFPEAGLQMSARMRMSKLPAGSM